MPAEPHPSSMDTTTTTTTTAADAALPRLSPPPRRLSGAQWLSVMTTGAWQHVAPFAVVFMYVAIKWPFVQWTGRPVDWFAVVAVTGALGFRALLVVPQFRKNREDVQLLRDGLVARASIVEKRGRPGHRGLGTIWTLTFRFQTSQGTEHTFTGEANDRDVVRMLDEDTELVIYDPRDPDNAVLLDALPDHLRVAEDGSLTPIPWRRGLVRSIPVVVLIVSVVVNLLRIVAAI
jgi:hypothetical protein